MALKSDSTSPRQTKARLIKQIRLQHWAREDYGPVGAEDLKQFAALLARYIHRNDFRRRRRQDGTEVDRIAKLWRAAENFRKIVREISLHRGTKYLLGKNYAIAKEMAPERTRDKPASARIGPLLDQLCQECDLALFFLVDPPPHSRGNPSNPYQNQLVLDLANIVRPIIKRNSEDGRKDLGVNTALVVVDLMRLVGVGISRKRVQNLLLPSSPANWLPPPF